MEEESLELSPDPRLVTFVAQDGPVTVRGFRGRGEDRGEDGYE